MLASGKFVRAVISQRAGGLLVVINMNPDQACNFDCLYCEVHRKPELQRRRMVVPAMASELKQMLTHLNERYFPELSRQKNAPADLMGLKAVALSGDGEPTLCTKFFEVVRECHQLRSSGEVPWFKLMLVSNAMGLGLPSVRKGLDLFTDSDDVWLKLDAGTPQYMKFINNTRVPLERVLRNIRDLGRKRPVTIQSLFCSVDGQGPSDDEIDAYVHRLDELRRDGTQIRLVQIYSVSRPPARAICEHLALSRLSQIAYRVREGTGLTTEVY